MSARALEVLLGLRLYWDGDCGEYRLFKIEHLVLIRGVCEDEFVRKSYGVCSFNELLRDESDARRRGGTLSTSLAQWTEPCSLKSLRIG